MKIEQAKQFAENALETLMAALEQGHSEALETYLRTMAKFRRYSWNNVLLIASQKPSATHVAGFHAWRKLGRHVRKGEKGIMILAPIVCRKRADERGGEEQAEQATGVRGFRAVHVFDLSQTDGEPLAEFATVTGDPKDYTERLTELVRKDGITLEFSEAIAPAKGLSKGGTIVLLPDLSPAESCAVLAHEFAHERLHKGERRARTTQCIRETEAEAVAFVVCEAIGLENNGHSADYVRLYDGDRETLEESLHHIQKTAAEIVGFLLGDT